MRFIYVRHNNCFLGVSGFKYPKKEVTRVNLKKLEGKYKHKNLVEFIVKNDHLVVMIREFEEALEPYNEIEFIVEMSARALRFEFTKEGKPEKVVVLNTEDEEFDVKFRICIVRLG